ncbi:MAG: hypothetical protein CMB99_13110 [Flavobacteriaceae bacterium]|nr:hypothetical protein [Flavobacteriaceae bacterium]|tara:strand:+ start:10423 stop:13902 length:3480 start_codon:yes stop_codon:yes gene_type:complete
MKSLISITCFFLSIFSITAQTQESFVCKEFKSGKTDAVDITYRSYSDIAMVQHLTDYYTGLRWEEKQENGVTVLKRTKKYFPRAGSKKVILKRPVATTSLIQKHFPKSYMQNLGKCYKTYRTAYNQRSKPPRTMTKAYQSFIEKDNRYFQKIARDCSDASNALKQWETRSAALLRDMRAHCINETKKKGSKKSSTRNKNSFNSTKKISYKKAKSSVKPSKIYPKGNFTPIQANATQQQIQQYQQNIKRQWNALNQSERRLSQLFENVFWKDYREEQAKEEQKAKKEARVAKSFQVRKFSNFINNWASYKSAISDWLTEYAAYVPNSVIKSVEKDLLQAKNNIRDIIRVRKNFMSKTKNYQDSYAIESQAHHLWYDFNRTYGRKIKNARFSALSELRNYITKNPIAQNKSMLADYSYIGYKHAKRYGMDSNGYARFIVEFFNDYPEINRMKNELEVSKKADEEKRRLSKTRRSINRIQKYSDLKDPVSLNIFIDSLISTNSKSKYQEALLSGKGNSSLLSNLFRNGYREEFLKLSNWLNIQNYKSSDLSMMTIKAMILSPNIEKYQNLKYSFYDLMNAGFTSLYKPKKLSFYSYHYYDALLNYSAERIKKMYSAAKSYNRGKGVYGTKQSIRRVIGGAYDVMLYFKLKDFKYLTRNNKKASYKYFLGIWTKPIDNWKSLEVTYVAENSPADKNGIQIGDKIIRIGNRGVSGFNYEGSPSPLYDGKKYSWFELLKPDGKVYRMKIPIRITKENIKSGFEGESKLISNSEELFYYKENYTTLVFNGKKKFANNSADILSYWGFNGFTALKNGYIGASFQMNGINAKAALSIDSRERKYIKNGGNTELSFWINDKGEFKIDNFKEKYTTQWIKSNAIKNGSPNLLSITKLDNRLQFFINGAFVYEINGYSRPLFSYCILAWSGTSIIQDYLHAYNSSEDEIFSMMVENPPILLDNIVIDESFDLSNKTKYKYFYEKNSSWSNLRIANKKIQHRFVGRWNSNYLELFDKKMGGAKTTGILTGKIFSSSFELSFDFQHSPSNNLDKAFFINFKKEGVYDRVKKKWDYENHYQWSWVAIRPSSTFLGQKLGGRNKPTENLPAKRIESVKGGFHNFKAIYNNDILKVFLNGEKIGEIKMRKGTTYWDISEPRSNGLRIKNLKVISGR